MRIADCRKRSWVRLESAIVRSKKSGAFLRHDLAFLHTAAVHEDFFAGLCEEIAPTLKIRHVVDEALLADARKHGITSSLAGKVHEAMTGAAATGATVVACTCSTLGGLAETTDTAGRFIAMRIDRAMADLAVSSGGRIAVIAALESTLEPTRSLLQSSARNANVHIELVEALAEGAWACFDRGDLDKYHDLVAREVQDRLEGADVIVLAQASMAAVGDRFARAPIPVLSSPRLGVQAAVNALRRRTPA